MQLYKQYGNYATVQLGFTRSLAIQHWTLTNKRESLTALGMLPT